MEEVKNFLTILLRIRNENLFLESFIKHYFAEGVDEIHILDDNSTQPFKFYISEFKLSHLEKADYNPVSSYSTAMKNLFYDGCKQTIDTTPDGLPPVEWTDSNPNVLVVDPSGETELDVI